MEVTNLNIRIDKDVKESAEQVFSDLGINMTSAVTLFLKQSIRDRALPFLPTLNQGTGGQEKQ